MHSLDSLLAMCKPDWVAWATFLGPVAAGLMALCAAKSVAARQERILRRQISIQSQMANLERHKIRLELLDRRVDFIRAIDGIPNSFAITKIYPEYKDRYEKEISNLKIISSSSEYLYGAEHKEYFKLINDAVDDYFRGKVKVEISKEFVDYESDFLCKMEKIKKITDEKIKPDTRVYSSL